MTPAGKKLRRVTTTSGGEEREPAWAPDGTWIALSDAAAELHNP